jgi:hypothetical protein
MNIKDWNWWLDFRNADNKTVITNDEYQKICWLHSIYFEHKLKKPCKCRPKGIQKYIDDLNEFWGSKPKPRVR